MRGWCCPIGESGCPADSVHRDPGRPRPLETGFILAVPVSIAGEDLKIVIEHFNIGEEDRDGQILLTGPVRTVFTLGSASNRTDM